jgi:hypothetical protein
MNTPTHSDTFDTLATFALQLILVTSEKNYTAVKTCIRTACADPVARSAPTGTAGILPAPPFPAPSQPSTLNPQPSTP